MKIWRKMAGAAVIAASVLLSGCGGGSGSGSGATLDSATSADITSAYTVLETSERDAFSTILSNTSDENVQDVLTAISSASAGGLDSAAIQQAYTDSLSRMNPFNQGTAEYALYEALVQALANLRAQNTTVFNACTTLITGMDDTELAAIVTVVHRAEELGFSHFSTLMGTNLNTIAASAPPASDDTSSAGTGSDDTGSTDTGSTDTGSTDTGSTDTGGSSGSGDTTDSTVITTAVAAGLGGDGTEEVTRGATTTTPLEIASRISVVDSTESAQRFGSLGFARSLQRAISQSSIDAWADSTDYKQDVTQVWVNDKSSESFGIINEILCSIEQTRFDLKINAGPYIAQVDNNLCQQNSADNQTAQKAGEGEADVTVPDYEYWVVDSLRESDSSVQVVYAWMPNKEDYGDGYEVESVIMARLVIYGDRDEYPPYGLFTINFKQVPYLDGQKQIDPDAAPVAKGMLKSFVNTAGENLVSFSMNSEMDVPQELYDMLHIANTGDKVQMNQYVVMATDGTAGRGATYQHEVFPDIKDNGVFSMRDESATYNIAFNPSYFLRQDPDSDSESCYERSNPKRNVYRYGIYDANGARVNLRSGIPIGYDSGSGIVQGWAGFWGISFNNVDQSQMDFSALNNQVVYKFDWATNALDQSEAYTMKVYPGKLRKIKRSYTTLDKIKNIQFSYWDNTTGIEYRIEWNGTGLLISGVRNTQNWTWNEEDSSTGTYLDLSDMQFSDIYVWSDALNGSVRIDLNGTSIDPQAAPQCTQPDYMNTFTFDCSDALTTSTPVIVYKEKIIQPDSDEAAALNNIQLTCYNQCPDPSSTDPQNPYFETWVWDQNQNRYVETSYVYTFDAVNMVLKYNGTPVTIPAGAQNSMNNMNTGALISQSVLDANPDMLDCPWDPNETCGWRAETSAPAFFRWETGSDSWNMIIALMNNQTNEVENFDQPLNVEYEHTYGDNSTKSFVLQYEGFGNLHGIPETCEDGDTGEAIDCPWLTGQQYDGWVRVISEFAIAAGAPAAYFDPATESDVDVVVKPLEEEHFMRANESTAVCTAAGLTIRDYTSQFVSLDGWNDPADFGMGAIPYADLPSTDPAVIAGEVQY